MFAQPSALPEALPGEYSTSLVLLSVLVAITASYVALDVAARIWMVRGWTRGAWIVAAATAMGGGIWSMHFIAMLALSLPMPVFYRVDLTLISLGLAICVTALGFTIIAGAPRWHRIIPAGIVVGLGVAVMHYTGMAAMQIPGAVVYEPILFALSVVIAVVAATAALWLTTRVAGALWRFGAAIVMGAAVCGMHYTGMAAACLSGGSIGDFGALQFEQESLALIVALGTALILLLEFVSAFVDRRFTAFRAREAQIMRLSGQRLQSLMQSTNDLVLVLGATGRIEFSGPSAMHAVGRTPEALVGRSLPELIDPEGIAQLQAAISRVGPGERGAVDEPIRLVMPDGSVRVFDVAINNLTQAPAVRGVVLTFHDMTVRQQAADDLRRAIALSDEANRMKTQFIANMSHELRTPLNAVIGLSELLTMEIDGPLGSPRYKEYADDIKRSGHRLLDVINDVLDIARLEANEVQLRPSPNDPMSLALEANRLVAAAAAEKAVDISMSVENRDSLHCDRRRIVQVLGNLLSNAVKFTGENGRVRVTGLIESGSYSFIIDDDGIGIAPEAMDGLFKPFWQADGTLTRKHEGSGLGLAISLALTRLHGGDLKVMPLADGGTRAILTLPIVPGVASPQVAAL